MKLILIDGNMVSSRCSNKRHKQCENISRECECKCHHKKHDSVL